MSDFPAATSGAVALIQRGTCGFTLKLQNAVTAGAVGVILFNEGDTAGRSNALFRSADPGYTIPAVLSSFAVGEELYNLYKTGQNPTVNLATNGVEVETLYPNVVAETKRGDPNHMVLRRRAPGLGPGRARASTTTARARRSSSSSPSSSPRRARRRATRSASCGSAARRTAWSARSTTPPTCPHAEVARTDMMLDTDMIASPNFARLVYDGDGSTFGSERLRAARAPARSRRSSTDYWAKRGLVERADPVRRPLGLRRLRQPRHPGGRRVRRRRGAQDGRSRSPCTAASQGEQLDPCYHEACDTYSTVTGQPPAETMNVYEADPTPANLAMRSSRPTACSGNALRSLEQFKGTLVHAIWYFARSQGRLPVEGDHREGQEGQASYRFKYQGHQRARTR